MADLNGLPQTTIRHDPWQHANMLGQMVHGAFQDSDTAGVDLYLQNNGSSPLALALSFWGSVSYDATFYVDCAFTGNNSYRLSQYLTNRYAQAAHGHDMAYIVNEPLVAYSAASSVTGDAAMVWSAAAGSRLTPFGPNGFTGVSLVLDATEKVHINLARTDGLETSQDWNIDLTWTGWDYSLLTIEAAPVG